MAPKMLWIFADSRFADCREKWPVSGMYEKLLRRCTVYSSAFGDVYTSRNTISDTSQFDVL